MKLMCLNGWGGALHRELEAYLAVEMPDVLCLQEVVHTPAARKAVLTYRDGEHVLQQRARFFDDVRAVLPGHAPFFCPAAQGILWDGDDPVPSQWGLATFVRAELPVTAQAQGFVHKSFSPCSYGDHPRSRSAHVVRLYDFERGWPVTIAHMHGLRDPRGKIDTPDRTEQGRRFAHLIASVAEPQDRVVVCGDFNVEPDSSLLSMFAQQGFRELVTDGGYTDTRTSHYKKVGRYADYMLVNSEVAVRSFRVVERPEVSDHRPLLLEL